MNEKEFDKLSETFEASSEYCKERIKEEKDLLKSWNGEHKIFPLEDGFSTTNIINKILESYE